MKSINKQFEEIGKGINEGMQSIRKPQERRVVPQSSPWVEKLREWLLIGLSTIVASAAIFLIIRSLIMKF